MSNPTEVVVPSSGDPFVRRVRTAWRSLTGGSAVRDVERATLVACSGGADSAALVLALADRGVVVGHVIHDLRPEAEARADRDATRTLAESLGLQFVDAEVRVPPTGVNAEAAARRLRYQALEQMAIAVGASWIATGHHADDQFETLLLRLCRGSGVDGMRGIAPRRSQGACELIRPMLGVRRTECEQFCATCGYVWRHDATNDDRRLARAALRASVTPALLAIEPRAVEKAEHTARQMRAASAHLRTQAIDLMQSGMRGEARWTWKRAGLRAADMWVLGQMLRLAGSDLCARRHADRRGGQSVGTCVRAIQDGVGGERMFHWRGVRVLVRREEVIMEGTEHGK